MGSTPENKVESRGAYAIRLVRQSARSTSDVDRAGTHLSPASHLRVTPTTATPTALGLHECAPWRLYCTCQLRTTASRHASSFTHERDTRPRPKFSCRTQSHVRPGAERHPNLPSRASRARLCATSAWVAAVMAPHSRHPYRDRSAESSARTPLLAPICPSAESSPRTFWPWPAA